MNLFLVQDVNDELAEAFKFVYDRFAANVATRPKLLLTTYFGEIGPNLGLVASIPVEGIHVDLVRAPKQLPALLKVMKKDQVLSLGVVDGRNIWKTNFSDAIALVRQAVSDLGSQRVIVASSSSLLHTPHTLENEPDIPSEIKDWFAFAKEKCSELAIIAKIVNMGNEALQEELTANATSIQARKGSTITKNSEVRARIASIQPQMLRRDSEYSTRRDIQEKSLKLPKFPTTTIGSFPQTKEIRLARNKFSKGEITAEQYDEFIKNEIKIVVDFQESVGLDVFVHGEPERNDMVQYFGEKLDGFVFSKNGWVQSYGSRCVRPPFIVGDVSRPAAMTVKESRYAKSLTKKPMKGMLTGPITILRWSFPRDDLTQNEQAQQIALALRDEVTDLEKAGIDIIQVDEPALREGCPLRQNLVRDYLLWAVDSFRLATSGVTDRTQIHSHFCYVRYYFMFIHF